MRFRLPGLLFSRVLVVVLLVSLGLPWAKASLLVSASMPRAMHLSPRSSDTAEGRGTAEADQSVDEMIARIQQEGRIRVLIGVRPSGLEERQAVAITDEKRMRIVADGQLELLDRMSTYSLSSVNRFKYIPFLGATVDGRALKALRADPGVTSIELVKYAVPLLSESGPLIGAPNAWSAGYSGAGWEVAILDTGVDRMHPFLAGKVTAEGCYSNTENAEDRVSLCPSGQGVQTGEGAAAPCAITGCDHGTHVAGIAAGSGVDFSGIARDAGIIAVQIFSRLDDPAQCAEAGRTAPCILASDEDQVRGLELVYSLRLSHQIAAVNLSIGGGRYQDQSQCDSSNQAVKSEVDLLLGAGIATIAASGNDEYVGAMNAPACISSVYSIGASTKDDRVANYSNTAPWLALYAPGGDFPPGSSDCTGGSTCIYSSVSMLPYGSYGYKAGTSMAAPHITGAWAVLKSTKASASAGEIYSTIQQTGHWLTDNRDGLSRPRIQLDEAVERLKPPSSDTTAPTASWISPSNGQTIVSRTLHLEANASDDASGVKEVRFSAKYNGAWNGLAVDTSSPYVFDWDMCSYGVPDGDVELGLEATDNAGNKYVYSSDHANIHINKSYNCNTPPPQGCAAPTLIAPSDGETLGSRTITFSWNPVSGCSFNGYTFRVCTSSDVETLSNCFIDSGEGSTQRTETITDHDNMDLWWGVKAANASAGSSWAVRRFTINPAAANGQWNASYFNTRTCWDDHNNCNGTTFNETLYVPGGGTLIDKNYGSSSPGGSIGSDNWTGRYEGTFNFATGNYVFYADHDDGLKLNIWNYGEHTKDSSGTNSVICNGNGGYFLSGDMPIRLYLREDGGDAKIKLRWSTDTSVCGSGSGGGVTGGSWSADYFNTRTCWDDHNNCNGTTYHDSPSFPGADTLIDKNWGQSSPGGGIGPDNWTGRFINTFNFQPAKYVFYADHDDGLKLQFGSYGEHTKDSSGSNSMICDGADGYYLSGNQQVKLYLREDGGDARVKLRWNTDTTACLPVPSAPTAVVASDGTYSDHIRVTWNAASYATVYEVWRNSTNNSATAAVIHNYVTATSYDDAYIVPGQTYYYWIKAKNSKGTSGFSASDSGFASVPPPAAPTGVSASDGDYTDNVLVTWLAVPGATSYEVWRNTADNSSSATQIAAAVNGTSYADTTVSIGQTYYYWTKARNVSGAGPFSTSDSGYAIVPAPTAPTGVTATDGVYVDRVRINWLAAPGGTSYEVWRNTTNETSSASRIAPDVAGTEYDDVGTTSDQTYFYWIKAKNGGGTSSFSATDSGYSQAPAPTAVSDLAASASASGALLVWTHTDSAISHYRIYRSENPYFTPGQGDSVKMEPDIVAPAIGAQASYADSAMCPGDNVPCFYAVVGVSQYGKASEVSNRVGIFSFSVVPGSDPQNPTPTPTPTATPSGDLIAWWGAEDNALDSAGNNDGTLFNGAGYGPGKIGQGFVFDGIDDYVLVPYSPALSPQFLTISAWVRFDSFYSGTCGANAIVSKGAGDWGENYMLFVQDTGGCGQSTGSKRAGLLIRTDDGSGISVLGTTPIVAGEFYHLSGTWDGSTVKIYVDGILDGQTGPYTGKALMVATTHLTIGRLDNPAGYNYWVDGIVDEVKIFDRALSESEISLLWMNMGLTATPTPTATSTSTFTPSPSPTLTATPSPTPTRTSTPTSTPTPRAQWELLNFEGIGVLTVEYSPLYAVDHTILASSYDGTVSGLYRSTDAGATWQKDQGWTGAAWDIVFSPNYASDSTLFAATDAGDFVRRSTDGGTSWVVQGPSSEKVRSLSISPGYADDHTVFAGTFSGHVYRTLNGGATWTDQGLLKSTSYQVRALAVSPNFASDRTVFAGLNPSGGVYRSTDAGSTWTAVNSGLPSQNIAALAISPDYANDQMVLVTCWDGGVYRSVNGGNTWSAANTGQPNRRPASGNTLVFSPGYLTDHTLFYATWGENTDGGVYRSTNGAQSWEHYSDGLGNRFIHHLSLSPNFVSQPGILAGGELANGGGLWVR